MAGFEIGTSFNDFRATGHRRKMDVWKWEEDSSNPKWRQRKVLSDEDKATINDAMEGAYALNVFINAYLGDAAEITWIEPELRLNPDEVQVLVATAPTVGRALEKIDLQQKMLDWLIEVAKNSAVTMNE